MRAVLILVSLAAGLVDAQIVRTALGVGSAAAAATCTIPSVTLATNDVVVVGFASTTGVNSVSLAFGAQGFGTSTFGNTTAGLFGGIGYTSVTPFTGVTAGTQTITVTFSGSAKTACFALKLTGVAVDRLAAPANAFQSAVGSSATPSSGATPNTAYPVQIAIGVMTNVTASGVGGAWSGGFSDGQSNATNLSINEGFLQLTTIQAVTAAKTGATNAAWVAAVLTFVGPRRSPRMGTLGLADIFLRPPW